MKRTAIQLINCPDRKGIVSTVAGFLYEHGANILHADQHGDDESSLFFMRVEWALEDFDLDEASLKEKLGSIAAQFSMTRQIEYSNRVPIVAIFVSSQAHCLADLLHRHQTGELNCRIALVISNHQKAEPLTRYFDVPFFYMPVTSGTKPEAEQQQLALLADHSVDFDRAGPRYAGTLSKFCG